MATLDRRTFLRSTALAAGLTATGGPFAGFLARAAAAPPAHARGPLSYGPLAPVEDLRDGVPRLLLPAGFEYRSFDPTGTEMSDGATVPGRHDGMAAFPGPNGKSILVRNHEVNGPVGAFGDEQLAYDPAAGGGTTTVIVDGHGNVEENFVSLNGTQMNCSGGPMPWGSWISCEETVNGPGVGNDFTGQPNSELTAQHGYIFEVPAGGQSDRQPIKNAGLFAHEAAEYHAGTNAVYLTEDNFGFPSGFYRYLPPSNPMEVGSLEDGGRLQMLAVRGRDNLDLSGVSGRAPTVNSRFPVKWVDIDDPDPDVTGLSNNEAIVAVGDQGRAKGAALFSRLEGAASDGDWVYFCSTQGGRQPAGTSAPFGFGNGRGQIWGYHTKTETLKLIYESPSAEVLDFPDNLGVSQNGTIVICEDGGDGNFLRGLTPEGRIFDFAKNNIEGRTDDEFAGSTFSPDFETLFVNIQASNGLTFAIWGPWEDGGFASESRSAGKGRGAA